MRLFRFYQVTHWGSISAPDTASELNATQMVSEGNGCTALQILKQHKWSGAAQTESKRTDLTSLK